jgi:dihydrofolate reductase
MRKLIAAFKVSLDMKFQGPGDYADWVSGWSDDYDLSDEIDACILGGAMYRGYERYWSAMRDAPDEPSPVTGTVPTPRELEWCARIPDLPHYVLARTMHETAWPNTRFLRDRGEISELKALQGKNLYLMGGGRLLRDMIAAGQVDELRLIVYPVIAGGPNTLFSMNEQRHAAELIAARSLPGGLVRADYRVNR